MKLKLVESGGIVGKKRTAETVIDLHKADVGKQLKAIFSKKYPVKDELKRDALRYFIEYKDKRVPLSSVKLSAELELIIEDLKEQLKYK